MVARKRLGELLIEAGVIDASQLQSALGHQRKWGGRLGQALVDLKLVTEARVVEVLAKKFGYEAVKVGTLQPGPALDAALKLVPREFASRQNVLPYATDASSVSVAMSDPANISVVDEIRFRTGRKVKIALAGDREIAKAIRRHYYAGEDRVEAIDLDFEGGDQPVDTTIITQFGGGSIEALDDFFSRDPAAPATPPPAVAPPATSPPGSVPPSPAPALTGPHALELEDLAPEAGAPAQPSLAPAGSSPPGLAAQAAPPAPQAAPEEPAERTGTLDLPLEAEIPPDAPAGDPRGEGPGAPAPAPAAQAAAPRHVPDARVATEPLLAVLEAVDRISHGGAVEPEVVKPSQLAATLVRLLIRKKVITVEDLVEEFGRR